MNQNFSDNFCGSVGLVFSNCTRSIKKQRSYYLKDVDDSFKVGSVNSNDWTTYFHAYPNDLDGVTIQYWRFYSFNTGYKQWGVDFSHGGDWESVQVKLNVSLSPVMIHLLGHTQIDNINWDNVAKDNDHPKIYSEKGGHSSIQFVDQKGIRQEAWSGGKVTWANGSITDSGILLNVGEKLSPINNQLFIQYSGLWGSPGDTYWTSGYWSPPYNETEMRTEDFFSRAWCNGMSESVRKRKGLDECKPCGTSR